MKDKEKLSMYVDITRITIILCWIALIAFWCLKLFGGNWFEIMVENENFIKFSDLVQNTWLKHLVSFITVYIAHYLFLGASCQQFVFKGKQLIVISLAFLSVWFVSNFLPHNFLFYLPFYYGYIVQMVLCYIYQTGKKKYLGALVLVLEISFSLISMSVRNIDALIIDNYLVAFILSIDLYIMILLYYFYSNLIRLTKEN